MNTLPIQVLLIDDDSTSLLIVSGLLRKNNYEVVITKSPVDALSTLRKKHDGFDLVLSDVHMPVMDGFELVKKIDEEFGIPVVLMSGDTRNEMILKSLEIGASFYYTKPLTQTHLEKLWQIVYAHKSERSSARRGVHGGLEIHEKSITGDDTDEFASTEDVEDEREKSNAKRRKLSKDNGDGKSDHESKGGCSSFNSKKPKVAWTRALHNKFLEAINQLGPNNVVPRKILEIMNVPGLKREHVASHLQKYRTFLSQASETSRINSYDRPTRSSFALSHPSYWLNNYGQTFLQVSGQQPMDAGRSYGSQSSLTHNQPQVQQPLICAPNSQIVIVDPSNSGAGTSDIERTRAFGPRMTVLGRENEGSAYSSLDAYSSSTGERIQEEIAPRHSPANIKLLNEGFGNYFGHQNNRILSGFGSRSFLRQPGNA